MKASQKVTAAATALIITLTGSIVVTAPMTLPGFSPASSRSAARQLPVVHGLGQDSGPLPSPAASHAKRVS